MNPVAFQIGPFAVHWYGILIVTGILAATYLGSYLARLRGKDPAFLWDALVWCVVLGVIGARLYHVVTVTPSMGVDRWYYFRNPLKILALWEGGLGIYGAVAGGVLGLYIAARQAKQNVLDWMDIMVPGLALAQAIGRLGNFVNQELYGRPTDLPWAIYIDPAHRLPGFEMYERFHPTFLYESLWNLGTCLLLVYLTWRYRNKLVRGLPTAIYFISYSLIRFLLEFVRLDSATVGEIPIAQIVALIIIVAFGLFLVWRVRVHRRSPPQSPEGENALSENSAGDSTSESPDVEDTLAESPDVDSEEEDAG